MPNSDSELNKFENKSWFRLLKVLYFVFYAAVIAVIVLFSFSTMPKPTLDINSSLIKCNNGQSYAPSKNGIYVFSDALNYDEDKNARILCKYDTLGFIYHSNEGIEKNYDFVPVYTHPDNTEWFLYSLSALFIAWLVFKSLKVGGIYIIAGLKPNWKKEFHMFF